MVWAQSKKREAIGGVLRKPGRDLISFLSLPHIRRGSPSLFIPVDEEGSSGQTLLDLLQLAPRLGMEPQGLSAPLPL